MRRTNSDVTNRTSYTLYAQQNHKHQYLWRNIRGNAPSHHYLYPLIVQVQSCIIICNVRYVLYGMFNIPIYLYIRDIENIIYIWSLGLIIGQPLIYMGINVHMYSIIERALSSKLLFENNKIAYQNLITVIRLII